MTGVSFPSLPGISKARTPEIAAMYKILGRLATQSPWTICTLWLLAGIGIAVVAPPWNKHTHDDDIRFLPQRCDSARGYRLLEKSFPNDVYASRIIFALERDDRPLSKQDYVYGG